MAVLELTSVSKNFGGLRPLRIASLVVGEGERVALSGIDALAAEVLVSLVTGAALPDEGDVSVLGVSTREIATDTEWLESLDRLGIVTSRAVLLEDCTVEQNLAMPYTLQIEPVPEDLRANIRSNAAAAGIDASLLNEPIRLTTPDVRVRAHLARSIALGPVLLVLDHPTVGVGRRAVPALAHDVRRLVEDRNLALLALTEDQQFAERVADRRFRLHGGTGALIPVKKGWFG